MSEETLRLADLAGPIGLLVVGLAAVLLLYAALRPRMIWPLLVFGAIVGSGPKLKGYVVFDEIFLLALVAGGLLALVVHGLRERERPSDVTQSLLFGGWAAFMVLQSARGMLFEGDPRILRWIVMYLAVGVLAHLLSRYQIRRGVNWYALVAGSTFGLFVVYVVLGLYWESTMGPGARYYTQGYIWSGTAGAVFPTVIAFPAALLLLEKATLPSRILGLLSALTMTGVAWYYDSRFSWVMIGVYLVLWLSRRVWMAIGGLAVVGCLLFLSSGPSVQNSRDFFEDETRGLQLLIAADAAAHNWTTAAIGAGIYSHRTILAPYAEKAFNRYISNEALSGTWLDYDGQPITRGFGGIYRTTGLPAFFIDTGVLGMMLFAALFVVRAVSIARSQSTTRRLWLAALGFCGMALVIFNPIDEILFYLLLMPNGLLDELACAAEGTTPQRARARAMAQSARPLRVATS